ncbi:EF-P 5-aminopentanol modification-associated protein YfmF [Ectobacillus polymachus]|uniref:EF-P 5-aminopentanol modification-associated protein YfmF n=1 Tax=Ectobacillus polymachus TaxID=1508806 RepID=UPI003A8A9DEB
MQHVQKIAGLTVHTIRTVKYKTNTLVLRMKAPLASSTVTYRALLPYVLQSGTKTLPTVKDVREYVEEMYGASLAVDVGKKGEEHIISIYMDVANEIYLHNAPPLLEKAIQMLSDVLQRPSLQNGAFQPAIVEAEKRALIQRIDSVYDDKMRYASERLIEEMCQNEDYRLSANGKKEEVASITPRSLYDYYQQALAEDEIDLYLIGDLPDETISLVQKYFDLPERNIRKQNDKERTDVTKAKEIIEKQDLKQSKLHIGYRTNITYKDEAYFALQVFNGLFGGFSHSKLFVNVREKNSLAYYAASRYESHKGLLFVMSGIQSKNYEKALAIIKEQLTAMQNGDFTDEDVKQTQAVIANQILETIDMPRGLIEILYHNVVANVDIPIEQWIPAINKVTKDEIIAVAKNIKMDTVYLLRGLEEV